MPGFLESLEEAQGRRVIRTIVDQNDLEVLEALPSQAIKRAPQIPPMVEAGNDHAQQGLLRIPLSGVPGILPERRGRTDIEDKMDQVPSFSPSHERKAGGRENIRRCRKWADLTPFTRTPVRFPWRPLVPAARPQAGSRVCSWPRP